jgi:hypothetical protein
MEEDKKQNEQTNPDLGDWDPDHFPTSAKPVFRKSVLLVFFLGALCFLVYQCSEHETPRKPASSDSFGDLGETLEDNPFGDEEEELESSL